MSDQSAVITLQVANQASPAIRQTASDAQALAAASTRAADADLRLAQARARLASVSGDSAGAITGLRTALDGTVGASERVTLAVQTQIASLQNGKTIAQQFGSAISSSFLSIVGPAALITTVIGGIGKGIGAAQDALALRETQNSLKAVSGDLNTYNQTLAAAREQQRLFGGTLQENIEGLSGLTITARSSGASLKTLIDLSQRLAVLDPAQGAQGARIALNEALSGDPTSLAKRYEIPRAALLKLRDTTLPVEERLKVIDSFLNKVGITSESVAGKVDQDALAFRRLSQELGDVSIKAGSNLASNFSSAATGLSRLVGVINGNPQAIAELKALLSGKGVVTPEDVQKIQEDQARARAKSLIGQGQATGFSPGLPAEINVGVSPEGGRTLLDLGQSAEIASQQLTQLLVAGGEAAAGAERLTQQWKDGVVSSAEYARLLSILAGEQGNSADVEDRRARALQGLSSAQSKLSADTLQFIDGLQRSAEASALDSAKKDLQATSTKLLNEQTSATVDAFIRLNPNMDASGAIALAVAQKYPAIIGQIAALRIQLQGAKNDLAALGAKSVQDQIVTTGRTAGQGGITPFVQNFIKNQNAQQLSDQNKLLDSEIAVASAKKSTAQQIDLLRQKEALLAKDTTLTNTERAAAINQIEAQIISITTTEAKGGRARVGAAQTTALQLTDLARTSGEDRLRIERENLERLADQEQDFNLRRTRSQEDYDKQHRKLLAEGKFFEARQLAEKFALDQKRAQEDFDIQRTRTIRNNAESLGDLSTRVENRTTAIGERAALRGVRTGGSAPAPAPVSAVGSFPASASAGGGGAFTLRLQIQPTPLLIDGKTLATITWPEISQLVDNELAADLQAVGIVIPPGTGQSTALSGARP